MVFMSGMPPFDPDTGELLQHAPFERQAERILEQMKTALEAAGSDLDHVLKCNVLCISAERFQTFNAIYKRYFPKNPPAESFLRPEWTAREKGRVRFASGFWTLTWTEVRADPADSLKQESLAPRISTGL